MLALLAGFFAISFLVLIHEAGHFIVARIFGIAVPVFSIGMGARLFGFTWRGTDYRFSALPVGGYVQMAGADPFGEEDADALVDPEESFTAKPVWQRLLVMLAGPGVNLALPFALFVLLLMLGQPSPGSRVGMVLPGTAVEEAGLRVDDRILAVDGQPVQIWRDVEDALARVAGRAVPVVVQVLRDDAPLDLTLDVSNLRPSAISGLDLTSLGMREFYVSSRIGVDDPASPAAEAGLRTGDAIIGVDGASIQRFDHLLTALSGASHELTVLRREGDDLNRLSLKLEARPGFDPGSTPYANPWGLVPAMLFASRVEPERPAALAGIEASDRFLTLDGAPVLSFDHFMELVARSTEDGTPRELSLKVRRAGEVLSIAVTPQVRVVETETVHRPIIGVSAFGDIQRVVPFDRKYHSLAEAVPRGAAEAMGVIEETGRILRLLVVAEKRVQDNVGGPVAIFQVAGVAADQGFFTFARFIGVISVSLGIINLLPIPVLDGGQIAFLLVEQLRGRPLSLELRERVQMVSVVGLVILMLLVTANDIQRWVGL